MVLSFPAQCNAMRRGERERDGWMDGRGAIKVRCLLQARGRERNALGRRETRGCLAPRLVRRRLTCVSQGRQGAEHRAPHIHSFLLLDEITLL
jgi:hypothetical protein